MGGTSVATMGFFDEAGVGSNLGGDDGKVDIWEDLFGLDMRHPDDPQMHEWEEQANAQIRHLLGVGFKDIQAVRSHVLGRMGLIEDSDGTMRRMTEDERISVMTDVEKGAYQNLLAQQERNATALQGNAPLSEGTIKRQADERTQLNEQLSRSGGLGGTAGAQATSLLQSSQGLRADAERRAEIGQGTQLALAGQQLGSSLNQQSLGNLNFFPNQGLGLAQGYRAAQQPYQYYSGLLNQKNIADYEGQVALTNQLGSSLGSVGSSFSSREYKEDIELLDTTAEDNILTAIIESPVYNWRYIGDDVVHTGFVTEEAPDMMVTSDGKMLDGININGALMAAVKSLARKVQELEGRE